MSDDGLAKFMRHNASMRQITKVELVNNYWQRAHEIVRTGRMGFVIRGNAIWEPERPEGVESNGIWLKSNRYDPAGKHIAEEPVRTYLQWYMNIYEIWGTIDVDINPDDALVSKPLIEQAVEKAMGVSNTISLLYGVSLRWAPAFYGLVKHVPMVSPPDKAATESWDCLPLQRSQEEHTATVLKDEHVTDEVLPLVNTVEALPLAVRSVIRTAIDWHAQANHHASALNRFVNYWQSIELLGNHFYKRLPADVVKRKSGTEKRDMIMNLLKDGVTPGDCMDVVTRCNEIRRPSAQTRVLGFLGVIADRDQMETALFRPDQTTGKSLYQIRNDIVHGELSENDLERIELLNRRLLDARRVSRKVLLLTIERAADLEQALLT